MINKIKISGLNCGHCAQKLENEIKKLNCIKRVEVNFLKSIIEFETDDKRLALEQIKLIIRKVEPDVKIMEEISHNCCSSKNKLKADCCNLHEINHHKHCKEGQNCSCCEQTEHHKKSKIIYDMLCLSFGLLLGILSLFINNNIFIHYFLLIISLFFLGWKVYIKALKMLLHGAINENLLLTISVFGAVALRKDMEAVMVISLYSIGKILESIAIKKSRKEIAKLSKFKPQFAVVVRDNKESKVSPNEVRLGETIIIRPGESVPIDCEVLYGQTSLNMQSLTGESLPLIAQRGDKILSGAVVLDGVITAKTTSIFKDSTVSKILNLIENNQQKKSKIETAISRLTKWYTLGVLCLSFVTFLTVFIIKNSLNLAVYRALIILVISCPCAFAISVPLSYFSGIGYASSRGILIKGSAYLDACAKIKTVVFDKTGTLTTGKFEIERVVIEDERLSEKDVIYLAGIGEQYSIHPLAKSITERAGKKIEKAVNIKEIIGEGVYYTYQSKNYFVGRKTKNIEQTCVELFENNKLLARIYLKDKIKITSENEIKELKKLGIKTVILSGDKKVTVENLAKKLSVDDFKFELLPHEKSLWIEKQREKNGDTLAFVGDGLNDAPSLILADVGICMGLEGNPASVEASDIVLSDDNPNKLSKAIKISKFTKKIVWQNILFSALIKVLFLSLGIFGLTKMLFAVLADVGVTVLAILNSLRILKFKEKK